MGNALQKFAGYKLKDKINRFTTNPIMGVLVGFIVTVLIQSSSGTTVIIVGLVSAGLMTLRQAIGVIMGANIGTSVNAFIIDINILEYSLPVIVSGVVMIFIYKNKRKQNIGQFIFGLGALFFGLELMADGLKPISTLKEFYELTVLLSDNSISGVIFGAIFTGIVHSSSITTAVLQELVGPGLLDMRSALPVLFGNNIGTTITAVLASIGTSIAARRAALSHVMFNIIGTVIFMIFIPLFTSMMQYLQQMIGLKPEITIAFADGLFNLTNTIIQLPLIGILALIVTKLIPGEDARMKYKVKYLDPFFIEQSTSIALGQAKEAVIRMGEFATLGMEESKAYQLTYSQKNADTAMILEDAINQFDRNITEYLILMNKNELSTVECVEHNLLLDVVRDIERVGDHFENVVNLVSYQVTNKVFKLTKQIFKDAMLALDDSDTALATKVLKSEEQLDKLERHLRNKHINRMNEGKCTDSTGVVFVDLISNLESIGDHSVKIAEAVLGYRNNYK
jgi:phosphate:Na+ symporter